jgi:hypothetical protein
MQNLTTDRNTGWPSQANSGTDRVPLHFSDTLEMRRIAALVTKRLQANGWKPERGCLVGTREFVHSLYGEIKAQAYLFDIGGDNLELRLHSANWQDKGQPWKTTLPKDFNEEAIRRKVSEFVFMVEQGMTWRPSVERLTTTAPQRGLFTSEEINSQRARNQWQRRQNVVYRLDEITMDFWRDQAH